MFLLVVLFITALGTITKTVEHENRKRISDEGRGLNRGEKIEQERVMVFIYDMKSEGTLYFRRSREPGRNGKQQ